MPSARNSASSLEAHAAEDRDAIGAGDGSGRRKSMGFLWVVLVIAAWVVLNAWLLPRLGVKT
jgi:hypothetical protein